MTKDPLHILLADDDAGDRLLFTEAFEELKLNTFVQTVNNGVQLMEYLMKDNINLPDIIFLDLNMPKKNGLECLKEIRRNKKLKDIPIAIYSTSELEKDIQETFRNGANVYINKPIDFNVLKQFLKKVIMSAHIYREPPFKQENFLLRI